MVKLMLIMLLCMAGLLSAIGQTSAVKYTFHNTANKTRGGIRYNKEVGADYSLKLLQSASEFIWKIFQQTKPSQRRKDVKTLNLIIEVFDEDSDNYMYTNNDGIHLSDSYVQFYKGDLKARITALLYHEVTHTWQWDGKLKAPDNLLEAVAEYVAFKAGYSDLVKPGEGSFWDQGYYVTARFLDYCNDLGHGNFVAQLNKKMRYGYSDSFFEELLGKNVDALWSDYKAKYSGH